MKLQIFLINNMRKVGYHLGKGSISKKEKAIQMFKWHYTEKNICKLLKMQQNVLSNILNEVRFPQMRCQRCKHLTQLDFNPTKELKYDVYCKHCGSQLFKKLAIAF